MARNADANLVERHIEKIILGLCAVALVVVVVNWVFSSPRTVEVLDPARLSATVEVTPPQADETLLSAARNIRQRNQDANSAPPPVLDWSEQVDRVLMHPLPAIASVDFGQVYAQIHRTKPIDPNALPDLPELTAMVLAPEKPSVWAGLEIRQPPEGSPAVEEVFCHATAAYSVGELMKKWDPKLSRLPKESRVVFARVEVQIRSRTADGKYASEEGVAAPLVALPPVDAEGKPLPMPVIPAFDGNNLAAIRAVIEVLAAPNWQRVLLTPPFPLIFYPRAGWVTPRIHLPDNPVSRLESGMVPGGPAGAPAPVATPRPAVPAGGGRPIAPPPDFGVGSDRGTAPPPDPGLIGPGIGPGSVAPSPTPAMQGVGPAWPDGIAPLGVKANSIPEMAKQIEAGQLLLAAHVGPLKPETVYQVRFRVVLVNPLLGQDAVRDKKRDSYEKEIVSPWGPWSDEFRVVTLKEFFLTGTTPTINNSTRLRVTVFTKSMGQTVSQVFEIEPGSAIGGVAKAPVSSPTGGTKPTDVNFATGCVAVEIDPDRRYLKKGVMQTSIEVKTTSLLYLDEKGQLQMRVLEEDQNARRYKELQAEAAAGR